MNRKNKMDEFIKTALDRMFVEVGFSGFDKKFTEHPDWYMKKEWSEEQERSYRDWFISECRSKLRMTKKKAEHEAGLFLLFCGWRTKA